MDISDFIVSDKQKHNGFEYGIKLVPKRAMDKFVDSILVLARKNISECNKYKISFKKRCGVKTILNDFELTEKDFLIYIEFLTVFKNSNNRIERFQVGNFNTIELTLLSKKMIKISVEKNGTKLFFSISKKELEFYISMLKNMYLDNAGKSSIYHMNYIVNPLIKKEREKLYTEVLYTLIDGALDNKNEELFRSLCKELKSVRLK
ncbi:IDEAL domain-containing protein [Clostridium sp. WILCCON 0269]|uniref:IDEAL domain-containing protein n=1 Tax=Candidatus Clostridium eludens TaxID=3381663 RepID=A0ABW8SL92_9CLOT